MLTACGIETLQNYGKRSLLLMVATVLTACGIETWIIFRMFTTNATWLQQCLPLAVLKRIENCYLMLSSVIQLQQCLPLAVLKLKGGIMST